MVRIATGKNHSLAIKGDNTIRAWGANDQGQLGDGTTVSRFAPVQVAGIGSALRIEGGGHTLAVKEDGSLAAWGDNTYGQLGNGTLAGRITPGNLEEPTFDQKLPMPVPNVLSGAFRASPKWIKVTHTIPGADIRHSANGQEPEQTDASIASGDSLAAGSGTTLLRFKAFKDGWASSRVAVSLVTAGGRVEAGANHSLALTPEGKLWSWGRNDFAQLGNGSGQDVQFPVRVNSIQR